MATLWASAFPAIRTAAPALGVFGLTISRLLIAYVTLVVIGMVTNKVRLPGLADLPLIVSCGICGMAGYFLLLNWGELYVPAGTASMATTTSFLCFVPVNAVGIGYLWLDEIPLMYEIAGGALTLVGVVLLNTYRTPRRVVGQRTDTETGAVA